MKTVSTPGFTAEAALSFGSGHYQANGQDTDGSEIVQAAYQIYRPPFYPCFKWLCFIGYLGRISCGFYPGTWNPTTNRCE